MTQDKSSDSLLGYVRVLDLTDEKGLLCGKILGDLGADVIMIEKPGGNSARNIGPFYKDIPHPEKSLYWFAYCANKRGITLDIEKSDGRQVFRKLVKGAHFVVESFPPGYMDSLGLGYSVLSSINPKIIMVSIAPFGQTGPYRDYKSSDLGAMAAGGFMYLCGDSDRAPVRVSFPQSYLFAGAYAAAGAMIAHYHRQITGEGQYVDTSIQESIVRACHEAVPTWQFLQYNSMRAGSLRGRPPKNVLQRRTWPCKDGSISFMLLGGPPGAESNKALVEWMDSEGMATDTLKRKNWNEFDYTTVTQVQLDELQDAIGKFFMKHIMTELYEKALEKRILLYPVNTVKEIAESEQLAARNFWVKVEHPELHDTLRYLGLFASMAGVSYQLKRAPLIGEHNNEIYGELGFTREQILTLKQGAVI